MKISLILGSVSDYSKIKEACDFFKKLDVQYELRALSAHRASEELDKYITENDKDVSVYIAAAGKAAHLPGVIASKTIKPVIGIPLKSSALEGMDALLSIVQMPSGVPVATVAIDGAKNAAILACQILSISDKNIENKLKEYKSEMTRQVLEAEKKLLKEIEMI